jgi:hypothetical protein
MLTRTGICVPGIKVNAMTLVPATTSTLPSSDAANVAVQSHNQEA